MQLELAKDNQVDKSIQFWRKVRKNKRNDRNNNFRYISVRDHFSIQDEKFKKWGSHSMCPYSNLVMQPSMKRAKFATHMYSTPTPQKDYKSKFRRIYYEKSKSPSRWDIAAQKTKRRWLNCHRIQHDRRPQTVTSYSKQKQDRPQKHEKWSKRNKWKQTNIQKS